MRVLPDRASAIHASDPVLIQGGMGVGVSNWRLARAVAMAGERLGKGVLGVVSGTGLPVILVNRIQARDADALRALRSFHPGIAREILDEYLPGRRSGGRAKLPPKPEVMVTGNPRIREKMTNLAVASAFVEVWLAKEGHSGPIGINLLEKVQLMQLPVLLGAMMAGADYVLVGAGIPHQVPAVLSAFARNETANYRLDVAGSAEKYVMTLDPQRFLSEGPPLARPKFLLIASHHALAMRLATTVEVDGFVMEGPLAGGHNAPARGKMLAEDGQPVYGEKDRPDLAKIAELGKPFWLAGGRATAAELEEAQRLGATGIQVGSAFALCDESGLLDDVKRRMREQIEAGTLQVKTSATASPSGFPFQVVQLEGTLAEGAVFEARKRICNLGHLVEAYQKPEDQGGGLGFRCPAEPVEAYVRKGGDANDTAARICLCNGLGAAAGQGRPTATGEEPMVLTLGKDLSFFETITRRADGGYSAEDVVRSIFKIGTMRTAPAGVEAAGAPLPA